MRLSSPLAASALLCVALSGPARAGGLGLLGTGGVHTAKAYYYDAAGDQGIDLQTRPNAGVGIEGILGASDDRILGLMRVYLLTDAPVADPDIGDFDPSEVEHPAYSELGWDKKGVATMGVQWSLYGDPEGFQVTLATLLGTGFATVDSLEFLLVDVGPGVTWSASDRLQLTATASATGRYRKGISYGGNLYAGVRYFFD